MRPRHPTQPLERTVPVLAERMRVGTRRRELGRVRVKTVTRERQELVEAPAARDEVVVRRVPVDRFVDGPVPDRYDGDTLIVSLLEEVPVVVKRLRVIEELHIQRRTTTGRRRERVVLRRQEPIIERRPPGPPALDSRRRP